MARIQSVSLVVLTLAFGFTFGQSLLSDFGGKWVLDLEKMVSVHPQWQAELTPDMWIVTGHRDRVLSIWRGVEATEVVRPDDVDLYDLDGAVTRISHGESEATVLARWYQGRVVATVTPVDGSSALTRSIYREDHWLVIEDNEDGGGSFRWYFVKT